MSQPAAPFMVLMVCLGNICRSPLAQAALEAEVARRGIVDHVVVDSAGTGSWHVGALADPRSRAVAAEHGIELTHRARQLAAHDFEIFDLICVMDEENLVNVESVRPANNDTPVRFFRSFDPAAPVDTVVPDPYYGGDDGFVDVWQMCQDAAVGLADWIQSR